MGAPRISVLMSVHNGESFLREAVDSILNQTYTDFEFIIFDDCSTDNSLDILQSYTDLRICIIKNEKNLGLTASLNKGLSLARGELIARMDADDISFPERFEKQVEFLDKNPIIGLVGTATKYLTSQGRTFAVHYMPESSEEIKNTLKRYTCFTHGSVMFRRICLEKVGMYREKFRLAQDLDYWILFSEHYDLYNLRQPLYGFRRGNHTLTQKKLSKQLDFHLLALAFAEERKKNGRDSYDLLVPGSEETFLKNQLGIDMSTIKEFKRKAFINNIEDSLSRQHDYLGSFLLLYSALSYGSFWLNAKLVIKYFAKAFSLPLVTSFNRFIGWRFKH